MSRPPPERVPMHEDEVQTASISPTWSRPPFADLSYVKPGLNLAGESLGWATVQSSATSTASRSPSPGTHSEVSHFYAASTSSWATSQAARPNTDCGFPNDEDADDEPSRLPLDRPITPIGRFTRSSRLPSRPSSLRNAISARDPVKPEASPCDNMESEMDESESDMAAESDTDEIEEEEGDDDNEWSGQNGNLEAAVIDAVDGDLPLAAFLIPKLHREYNLALKSKVESWQSHTTSHGNSDGSPRSRESFSSPGEGSGHSRKRRRRSGSDGGGRERGAGGGAWDGGDEGDEDDDNSGEMGAAPDPAGEDGSQPMLACPFHKRDPRKYGVHTNTGTGKKHKYRACTGPGFKSIQRLKEHLRRVHSPIQCDRCYETFPGTDRAANLARLAEHRNKEIMCDRRDPSGKEGIDEVQWAALEKQNRKKNQENHKVEKWFEIWDVLFPGANRPKTPWHDVSFSRKHSSSALSMSDETFAKLYLDILDHKIQQGDIDFELPVDTIRERLKSVAQQTFRTFRNIHGRIETETSSSSQSRNQLSLIGGSSTHMSVPTTAASHQLTASTAATSVGTRQSHASSNTYTLSQGAGYGMGIPMGRAQPPSHGQGQPPQFMASPHALAQVPSPAALHGNAMTGFQMGPGPGDDPAAASNFYYPYSTAMTSMFPPPAPGPQPGSWGPAAGGSPHHHVQFPAAIQPGHAFHANMADPYSFQEMDMAAAAAAQNFGVASAGVHGHGRSRPGE